MNPIANLKPHAALAALLDGKVTLDYGKNHGGVKPIRCYTDGTQPDDESYLSITWNGLPQSLTKPYGLFVGNLMLTISTKLLNGRNGQKVNEGRVTLLIEQCAELVDSKSSQGFFFELDLSQIITPTTTNLTTGYSTTILNVQWRVTDEFLQKQ